jgi:hypothetical protein
LAALIENVNEPAAFGEPERTPPVDNARPGGNNAAFTGVNVMMFGTPLARKVCVYGVLTFPLGTTVAVNAGATGAGSIVMIAV